MWTGVSSDPVSSRLPRYVGVVIEARAGQPLGEPLLALAWQPVVRRRGTGSKDLRMSGARDARRDTGDRYPYRYG